jgi:hypothetical protein
MFLLRQENSFGHDIRTKLLKEHFIFIKLSILELKKKIIITSSILLFLALASFVSLYHLSRYTADWKFIQEVGGIKTGIPLETEDGFYLPVKCNISGLDSLTVKPKTLNSALSCLKIKSSIHHHSIYIELVVGIAISKKDNCNCKAFRLGDLEPGTYTVNYGDRSSSGHQIGTFTIKQGSYRMKSSNI